VSEFHAEVPQATSSERLAQCPYMAVFLDPWLSEVLQIIITFTTEDSNVIRLCE